MASPAAKEGDVIEAIDTHLCDGAPFATPFVGTIDGDLSPDVLVEGAPAAGLGSTATNRTPHVPPPGKSFDASPSNKGRVATAGGSTVLINGRPIARADDGAATCHDLGLVVGSVLADGTVIVGDG
jgi:uncharacterized Zn-binding protein involved in type VI secretion